MVNEHKVVSANTTGFTVYYIDSQRHFTYKYDQPLLPYLKKLKILGDNYKGKRYQEFDCSEFNGYQRRLYKDAVYGLNSYSLRDLRSMTLKEKLEIKKLNHSAQQALNDWKQELVNDMVDDLLIHGLPHCGKLMDKIKAVFQVGERFTSRKEISNLSFADLKLTKRDVALRLMQKGILPQDFFRAAA